MDYQAIKDELLAGHPDTGAYNVDDVLATGELNAVNRTVNKSSLTGDEIFAATDKIEFGALTDHHQEMWVGFCGRDSIDPTGTANIDFLDHVFGVSSTTKTTLASLRQETVSRAVELGLGLLRVGDIQNARAL